MFWKSSKRFILFTFIIYLITYQIQPVFGVSSSWAFGSWKLGRCLRTLAEAKGVRKMSTTEENPLLAPWDGENGGLPPFGRIKTSDFKPALEQAIADFEKGITLLSENPAPPTFENLMIPLEVLEREFSRRLAPFEVYSANKSDSEIEALDMEFAPKFTDLKNQYYQNEKLFTKVRGLYEGSGAMALEPEARRLIEVYYKDFVHNGALLAPAIKKRIGEIDIRLSVLFTQFSQNLLKDETEQKIILDSSKGDLLGLPEDFIQSLREQGAAEGLAPGQAVLLNTRSAIEPFLTYSAQRDLREKAYLMFQSRGSHSKSSTYNGQIVLEILKLRQEKAKHFGYKNFVELNLSQNMISAPAEINNLMSQVWKGLMVKAQPALKDLEVMLQMSLGIRERLEPWDYRYYSQKYLKANYDFDAQELKSYLPLKGVMRGLLLSAEKMFGLHFEAIQASVFDEGVEVYKITDSRGQLVGYWYFDLYARPGKRSGAWMSDLRAQDQLQGLWTYPVITNNLNLIKGATGESLYLSWDEVNTLFHEFGHGLHGLTSRVHFPSLSGVNVPVDFVELPSQFYEAYALSEEVTAHFVNGKGEKIPAALLEKMKAADLYQNIFFLTEFMSSMWVDHEIHQFAGDIADPREFELRLLSRLDAPNAIPPRHPVLGFSHLFSSDGYAGNYSAYLVSQVLSDDANEAFEEVGNMYDPALAQSLLREIYSSGNTREAAESFLKFRGRPPSTKSFLKKNGLGTEN